MAGGSAILVLKVLADVKEAQKGLADVSTAAGDAGGGISSIFSAIPVGPLAIAGAATGAAIAIGEMTKAAAADRDEQAKLDQVIQAAGAATGDYTTQVEAAIVAGQKRAFSDSETRDALASLVTATGDVTTASTALATAQDVARFANVDLATAADAVAKATAGQDGPLRKLIPGLEKGATASDTLAAAQKAAAGQADLFASTTEGQMAVANDAFGELQETVGSAFLPIIDELVPAILPVIEVLGELVKVVMPALIVVVKLVVAAFKLVIDVVLHVVDWVKQLIDWIGPKLQPVLKAVMDIAGKVSDAIGGIGRAISGVIDWIGKGIDAIGKFLDKLNPLKDFKLPAISLPFTAAAPGVLAATGRAAGGGARVAASSGVTVNVYGGDPRRVEAAVRQAFRHWTATEGASAPTREW